MATQDLTLTSAWQLIATAGDEFLLTLAPGRADTVAVAVSDTAQTPTVTGHLLTGAERDGMNRTLLGPGYVYARTQGLDLLAALTAWTPS